MNTKTLIIFPALIILLLFAGCSLDSNEQPGQAAVDSGDVLSQNALPGNRSISSKGV